jgi:predicted RNA-binding protein with PUA-like domain
MPAYWLIKSEPTEYPFSQLMQDSRARWDGVRNFEARNNLRAMKPGDLCLFYHSVEEKAVVGVAEVVRAAYHDPTAKKGEDWSAVDIQARKLLAAPVPLSDIKDTRALKAMALLQRPRLSVTPVTPAEFKLLLKMGKTTSASAYG